MPRRRLKNRRRPPRRYRRYGRRRMRRGRNKATMSMVRAPATVPDRLFVKLKYSSTTARAPASTVDLWCFRGNSCYDPDYTGAGHQPYGYDQWCAATTFYDKYRVHSSKVVVKFINFGTDPMYSSIYPTLDPSAPAGIDEVEEVPYSHVKHIGVKGAGNSIAFMRSHMFTKKMFGLKTIVPEDSYAADYQHDPANVWYWSLYTQSGSITNLTYTFAIKITYFVEFWNRNQIAQS